MAEGNSWWVRATGIAFVVAVLGAWVWIEATPTPRVAPPPGEAIVIDKSVKAQNERRLALEKMEADGLIRRIQPRRDGTVRVSLRPAFYHLDMEARRKHVEAIYRYHFDGTSVNDTVELRDARHGNEIGEYNPYRGGLKMYK